MRGLASLEAIITIATMISLVLMITTSIGGLTKTWHTQIERQITTTQVNELVFSDYAALGVNTTMTGWYIEHNGP